MKSFFRSIELAGALLLPALTPRAVQSDIAPLRIAAAFPTFSGQTITDRPITLPESPAAKPTVLVFSFSRIAGKDARLWNQQVAKDFVDTVSKYGVIQLESAPKIFRHLAISGIKSSMPVGEQNETIVLYRDEHLWKQRLAVKDESRAYVVLLDRSGTLRWINSAKFSDDTYGSLKTKLSAMLPSQP